jgi:hypothetical protein
MKYRKTFSNYLNDFLFIFNSRNFVSDRPIFRLKRIIQNEPKLVKLSICGFYG